MQKILFTLIISSFALVVRADEFEKNYGRGVIHVDLDSVLEVDFYSAPGSAVTHRLVLTPYAWAINASLMTFDTSLTMPSWFSTLFLVYQGDTRRLDIIGVDSLQEYYKTILKDEQGREVWMKKNKSTKFLTWFGFYGTMASIELKSGDVILYDSPSDKAKKINYTPIIGEERAVMRALEVRNFWMKVELQVPTGDAESPVRMYTGWIKWRDEKEPLVKYNLMGC